MFPIETTGLARRFRKVEAVNGLDLAVPAGSVFALIGPNGAGKTTTMKLLMNLLRPTAGWARVLGTDSRRLGLGQLRRIGYVSENQQLPEWMTPSELLAYVRPFYPTWDDRFARQLQEMLGLTRDAALTTLSRGTKMKAALMAALAYRPELLVLDEPFSGLDPFVRDELVRALLESAGDRAWTVFLSSHDVEEVERLADHVGFMSDGRLAFSEPTASLLARFRSVDVVFDGDGPGTPPADATWIGTTVAGRTLRFVHTRYEESRSERELRQRFPGAAVSATPMPLREIFLALAREIRKEAA